MLSPLLGTYNRCRHALAAAGTLPWEPTSWVFNTFDCCTAQCASSDAHVLMYLHDCKSCANADFQKQRFHGLLVCMLLQTRLLQPQLISLRQCASRSIRHDSPNISHR